MRKLILVFAAIAISAGVYAQAGSTNKKASPQNVDKTQNQNSQNQQDLNMTQNQNSQNQQDLNNNQNQNLQNNPDYKSNSDGIYMENGKMMKVKNGQKTAFQDIEMTMSNGTKIMSDGTYIKTDGSKMTMKEGQHMDMSGNMVPMNTNKNRNMEHNHGVHNNSVDNSNSDGVMMQNGKMMKVKNGQKTALQDNTMTMSNGTKIMSDGTCIKKDGTKTTMKEGQHMDMSGNMVPTKTNKDKNMYLIQDSTRNREN
ncbi:MAG: hypothetical protein LC658_02905 [Bacteroidales bacterium]|nr:hypothetical protein [Bacteroidales bacterium]